MATEYKFGRNHRVECTHFLTPFSITQQQSCRDRRQYLALRSLGPSGLISFLFSLRPSPKQKPITNTATMPTMSIKDDEGISHDVEVPDTNLCWRFSFTHECGHPVFSRLGVPQVLKWMAERHKIHRFFCKPKDGPDHKIGFDCMHCQQKKINSSPTEQCRQGAQCLRGLQALSAVPEERSSAESQHCTPREDTTRNGAAVNVGS